MDLIAVGLLCSVFAILLLRYIFQRIDDSRRYNYPPGPKAWPIIGNILNVDMKLLHFSLWKHREKFGDVSHFIFGGTHFVVLNSLASVKDAMVNNEISDLFSGRPTGFLSDYFLKNDIIEADFGETWQHLRGVSLIGLKVYVRNRDIEMAVLNELDLLKQNIESGSEEAFDIYPKLSKSIGNIIYIMLIGGRFDYSHEIHDNQRLADLAGSELFGYYVNGVLTVLPLLRHIPISVGKTYKNASTSLNNVINHLRKRFSTDNKPGMLKYLLDQQEDKKWLTDDHIHDVIADFILAGAATTATVLYSLCLVLMHRQDIQKRLQDEVDNVVGRDQQPCLDDQSRMSYTQAVVLETLRYVTIGPFLIPRATSGDVKFRGYNIKKGTVVLVNSWKIHHDGELWEDPWVFKPERFLDSDGMLLAPDHEIRKNLFVFGFGKRRCIGEVLARDRLFLFVSHLCQRYTMTSETSTPPSMDPHDFIPDFLIIPKPYRIKFARRN